MLGGQVAVGRRPAFRLFQTLDETPADATRRSKKRVPNWPTKMCRMYAYGVRT